MIIERESQAKPDLVPEGEPVQEGKEFLGKEQKMLGPKERIVQEDEAQDQKGQPDGDLIGHDSPGRKRPLR